MPDISKWHDKKEDSEKENLLGCYNPVLVHYPYSTNLA